MIAAAAKDVAKSAVKAKIAGAAAVPTLILILILGFFMMGGADNPEPQPACDPGGAVTGPGITVDPASIPKDIHVTGGWTYPQAQLGATVILAAKARGADAYAQQLTLAAAMAESSLTNVSHGDAARNDTIGLFQQGPEHGSYADRMDPTRATYIFFDRMKRRNPDLHAAEPTIIIHNTQSNADPYHYVTFWAQAGEMMQQLKGARPAGGDASAVPVSASASASTTAPDAGGPNTAGKWNLGPVKPVTAKAADEIGNKFHLKTIGGWRDPKIEKIEPTGHPAGLAADFMVNDMLDGSVRGQEVADYVVAHAKELGVKHAIWQQHIWIAARPDAGWKPMEDRGSPTANHMDHVHVSFNGDTSIITSADGATTAGACPGAKSGPTDTSQVNSQGWAMPIKGATWTSDFGPRGSPGGVGSTYHQGDDLAAACGTPIFAAHDGTVSNIVWNDPSGGNIVQVDHGDGHTRSEYLHMTKPGVLVTKGQKVKAGDQIAKVGSEGHSTGCHLHFQILLDGKLVDPIPIIKKAGLDFGPYKGV